jgi:hypothetical protein
MGHEWPPNANFGLLMSILARCPQFQADAQANTANRAARPEFEDNR